MSRKYTITVWKSWRNPRKCCKPSANSFLPSTPNTGSTGEPDKDRKSRR